jgi:hypothetical protein
MVRRSQEGGWREFWASVSRFSRRPSPGPVSPTPEERVRLALRVFLPPHRYELEPHLKELVEAAQELLEQSERRERMPWMQG